jgi:hypothetical protein
VKVVVIESATVVDASLGLAEELMAEELADAVTVDVAGTVSDDDAEVVEGEVEGPGTKRVTPSARTPASAIATTIPSNVRLRNLMRALC